MYPVPMRYWRGAIVAGSILALFGLTSCSQAYPELFNGEDKINSEPEKQITTLAGSVSVEESRHLTTYKGYEFVAVLTLQQRERLVPCLAWLGEKAGSSQMICTTGGAVSGEVPSVGEVTFMWRERQERRPRKQGKA